MKVTNDQVRQALVEFVAKHVSVCFVGTVTDNAKAESEGYVTVEYNELEFDVRLQAVTGTAAKGLLQTPTKGSKLFCVSEGNSDNSFVAAAYTEVDKLSATISNMSIALSADGVVMNGGGLGGMVKLNELVDNLNSLKQYVEAMNSALPSAFTAIGAGTAAAGANGATSYNGAMSGQAITLKNMENDKIKQ